ncbi:hypothetical protein LguiA_016148 [Lonicera macranthoides]
MTTDTMVQDQKKRTMDALERRFALAEAEVRQQQQKNKKRPYKERDRTKHDVNPPSVHPARASVMPSSNTSVMNGNTTFSSHITTKDLEANDPAYYLLSHPVHENLTSSHVKISNKRGSIVDHILHELLQKGDSAQKYMQGLRSMKIDHSILLDNLVQGHGMSGGSRTRALQSRSKRSKRHMSIKQLKKCDLFNLPPELHNYEMFKPMHEMWTHYIMQHLKNMGKNQLARCLLSADLHGAIILVAECKAAGFTGVSGIMIRETAETFGIIAQDNKFRVVPKNESVFMLQADCWKITLHGDKYISRNLVP